MGTNNTGERDLLSPLLGPVQTDAERTARAEAEGELYRPMYAERPSVEHMVDADGFVLVAGRRVINTPGKHLRSRKHAMLTCQLCARENIPVPQRVVCEDSPYGVRYFHALVPGPVEPPYLCDACGRVDAEIDAEHAAAEVAS